MPDFKPYTKRQLDRTLQEIADHIYAPIGALSIRAWCTREPLPYAQRLEGEERVFAVGDKWGDLFDCAWFHFTGEVPAAAAGQKVVALLDVNGEMCVFDAQGAPTQGLTNAASGFDYSLGRPGKRVVVIAERAQGGESVDIWADAGCNDLFGNLQGNGTIKEALIASCHDEVQALYYDYEVLLDFLKVLPEDSPRYQQILTGLNDVEHLLYGGVVEAAAQARAILSPLLAQRGGDPSLRISAVGHAHMDLGWLWPIRETIRKGARTFSTALMLMDKYPDYVFGASQPQYFLWMKDYYPALYAKIKQRVAEGRLEPQGAMWVEADTNVSGGEALVRQLLQGKRFFKQEFGVDIKYLWLPDVFGYNGALPQLLKKAGVDYFSTQKLSWSLINRFPHQSFHWQGIDGSKVLTHMLPEETYNGPALPRAIAKIEQNYRDKGLSHHALMAFGIGDGGGGPGEEHLERLSRVKNLAGLSPVTQEPVAAFWPQFAPEAARFATWAGELYLERHEGTLTTEARNKWYNRKMELALREWEWAAALAKLVAGVEYPAARLETIWREVLLYQFHDILPGSSIKRVYDESVARYQALYQEVQEQIAACDAQIAAGVSATGYKTPVLVQNSLSWERREWVQLAPGRWQKVTAPPMGYQVVDAATGKNERLALSASKSVLENDLLRVQFAADGSIASIYDKRASREVLPKGQAANRLAVYADLGDAWDFPMDYAEQTPRYMQLSSATPRIDGPRAILKQVYRLGYSELTQEIVLTAGSARLDFVSQLHWREPKTMLRTSFPIDVFAEDAVCEIQYGHLHRPTHRNTTWEMAKDEIAAHKWVDLSQRDYGVALLNDSKYGYKVKDGVLDLDLLRSVPYPGPRLVEDADVAPGEPHHAYTDQCDHRFTYALYPHVGDHVQGGVIQEAYALNVPLRVVSLSPHPDLPPKGEGEKTPGSSSKSEGAAAPSPSGRGQGEGISFLQVDEPNVIIEAVKQAEDSGDLIVRLYECARSSARATLRFGFPAAEVAEVNLMEEEIGKLALTGNAVMLEFRPFEIKTVRVSTKQ